MALNGALKSTLTISTMEKELKILMLEDSEEDAWFVEWELQKENRAFTRLRVDTRAEFESALDTFVPDVILSDHSLPQFNSIEALAICVEKEIEVPFILVTGSISEEFATLCLKKGADDFVPKSDLSQLPLAIDCALGRRTSESFRRQQMDALHRENEELKRVNKELEFFAYSTSHNLRAPLQSVLGLVGLSKTELSKNNTAALAEYFGMMENSIGLLDHTIRTVLENSKNSTMDEEIVEIDFNKVLENIFNSLEFINESKVISMSNTVHSGTPLWCNSTRLGMVLLNLISNAIKYHDPAKANPFVKIEVFQEQQETRIVIEDNGIGIDEDSQHSVFDMFYRATKQSEGTGLGLHIVKETLERMNGSLTLHSVKGEGTTFTIRIPV